MLSSRGESVSPTAALSNYAREGDSEWCEPGAYLPSFPGLFFLYSWGVCLGTCQPALSSIFLFYCAGGGIEYFVYTRASPVLYRAAAYLGRLGVWITASRRASCAFVDAIGQDHVGASPSLSPNYLR
jgi:hypothetical protein